MAPSTPWLLRWWPVTSRPSPTLDSVLSSPPVQAPPWSAQAVLAVWRRLLRVHQGPDQVHEVWWPQCLAGTE